MTAAAVRLNVVRVEDDPVLSVEALLGFADEALAGLDHRRVDFDDDRPKRLYARLGFRPAWTKLELLRLPPG